MKAKKQLLGFTAASLSLTASFVAGGSPIPYYNLYAQQLGADNGLMSMVTVVYFCGTVLALLFLPRLTNYWGRKRAIYLTLALGIIACLLFADVDSEWRMMLAKFTQGLSCGLASSTVSAFIIDNEPRRYKGLAAVIIGSAPNVGLPVGAMGAGILNTVFDSLTLVFILVALLLFGCGALIFASEETITHPLKGAWKSLVPQIKMTPHVRRLLPAAACAFAGTWAVGGFYQSYSAAIGVQELGVDSTFIASLIYVSFIVPVAFGAIFTRGRDKFSVQRWSMLLFFIGVVGGVFAMHIKSLWLFMFFNAVSGAADGAAFTSSMAGILEGTGLNERAGVLSLIYIVAYGGAALPNLIIGKIAQYFTLFELTAGYAVFCGVMFLLVLLTARRSYYYMD